MVNHDARTGRNRRIPLVAAVVLLGTVSMAQVVWATPPLQPLPAPYYSFRLDSPTVDDGLIEADSVLVFNLRGPQTVATGAELNLGATRDELDALSSHHAHIRFGTTFTLLFSVDSDTVGVLPPDPGLVAAGTPYSAWDQAWRGQQAGDEFMSIVLFDRQGVVPGSDAIMNNVLVRNNFDEGGVDFGAVPPTSAEDIVIGQVQDKVDAILDGPTGRAGRGGRPTSRTLGTVFFSVSAASPSLASLPGGGLPSGAHVFVFDSTTGLLNQYAFFFALGLVQGDDIDALVVFDTNQDEVFNGLDRVFFSLTVGSPSLTTIPGASAQGAAADVFVVDPGGTPTVFATAAKLGLGSLGDNLDALAVLSCTDSLAAAGMHGIRAPIGSGTCPDGTIDLDAEMVGPGGQYGEAEYEVEPDHREFHLAVGGFPPGSHNVLVNDVVVGILDVDVGGEAELEYDSEDGTMPPGFPEIAVGDTVSVGGLVSGVFELDCD